MTSGGRSRTCEMTFDSGGEPTAYWWRCWTHRADSRLYDRPQDAKASATRHRQATADASSQTRSRLSTHPPDVLHLPTRSLPKCNTCTRSFDPDGKPLRYCAVCFQDMPPRGPSVTTDQAEETP